MLNRSASLAMSTSVLKALPGKLDIKRHSPSILYLEYVCEDTGAGGMTCSELRTFMGTAKKTCDVFFKECCAYCCK